MMMTGQVNELKKRKLDDWVERVSLGMDIAVNREVMELRRLKLPIIVSKNGKPVDINPDTNPNASSSLIED
jgi:hypothetical protein